MKTCTSENCQNASRTRGLCPKHYERWRKGREPGPAILSYQECSVSHCSRQATSRKPGALCDPHYQKAYRGFDPELYFVNRTGKGSVNVVCRYGDCARPARGGHRLCAYHVRAMKNGSVPGAPEHGVPLNDPCTITDCRNLRETAGVDLCHSHREQLRLGQIVRDLRNYGIYVSGAEPCQVASCTTPAIALGLCGRCRKRKEKYKLTLADLDLLVGVTECENPGCHETRSLHVDHDHDTGKVRGMLCASCNTSLGRLQEDVDRIRGLALYKETHS